MSIPFERAVTLTRSVAGAYTTLGVWVDGGDTSVSINATILPEKNQDVIAQLGGTNNMGMMTIRSESQILAADEALSVVGDKFTFDGRSYEVIKVNQYRDVIPHYKGWAKAEDDKES